MQIRSNYLKTQENLVKLNKRGRMLVASYEAVKFQRLDLFTVTLRQIGAYIAREQLKDAVDVLINGDGNDNAATVISALAENPFGYGRIVRENGEIKRIVEQKDASDEEKKICEINAGMYFFDIAKLRNAL